MADEFTYRADPPPVLAGGDIAALVRLQEAQGLAVVTPGRPLTAAELKAGPHEAIGRLSSDLAAARAAQSAPVKLCLPLPGLINLDPMLLQGLIGNLIDEGARILEFDGAAYADPATDPGNDGFTLMGLQRPAGFRLAVRMGALSAWRPDRLGEVAAELAADRYVFDVAPGDDVSTLASLPDDSLTVLALMDPAGGQSADAVLADLDRIAETIDLDRLALSVRASPDGLAAEQQRAVLRLLSDVSVAFWGFAT
jgi:hypothetical protein